jgi:hypothetical protein
MTMMIHYAWLLCGLMVRGPVVELRLLVVRLLVVRLLVVRLLVVRLLQRGEAGEQHSPATIWMLPSWRAAAATTATASSELQLVAEMKSDGQSGVHIRRGTVQAIQDVGILGELWCLA